MRENNPKIKIEFIKLIESHFIQKKNIENESDIRVGLELIPVYEKVEEECTVNMIVDLILKLIDDSNNSNEEEVISIKVKQYGVFRFCDSDIDEKMLPNLVAILYSYIRPLVSNMFSSAKIPVLELPILDLSSIKAKEINSSKNLD